MQIVSTILFNASVYFIFITNTLPFSLSFQQYGVLSFIILVNVILMFALLHDIGVVFLLLSVAIYLAYAVKKQKFLIHLLSAYLFSVFYNAIFYFVLFLMIPHSYVIIDHFFVRVAYLVLFYFSTRGVGKLFKKYLPSDTNDYELPGELYKIMLLNLFICITIQFYNLISENLFINDRNILTFNGSLFWGHFLLTLAVNTISIRSYISRTELEKKQESIETLQEYTTQIEQMYASIRSFKHDYVNIMTSISGFLEANDLEGLNTYFYKEVLPLSQAATMDNFKLNQVSHISLPAIKSIVSSKLIYAHEIGISVDIEVTTPIKRLSMEQLDLARLLGIFLDNAIEAALETQEGWLAFMMVQDDFSTSIHISNNYVEREISVSQLSKTYVSTKGKHRGIGLSNAASILSRYPSIIWEYGVENHVFTQKLEISNQ